MRSGAADFARRDRHRAFSMVCLSVCLLLSSCRSPDGLLHYVGPAHPAEYLGRATEITYPDLNQVPDPDVNFAEPPRTIRRHEKEQIWDLSLSECIQIALSQSEIIRNRAQFLSPQNPLLAFPDSVNSVYDPAIQEAGVLYGQRGVEAALSDFDTQFTTQMLWGRNETVQANTVSTGLQAGDTLTQETATFSSSLQKRLATGGQFAVLHNWNYSGTNVGNPPQLFPSYYEGNVQFQFRQPILAGGGVDYTRIAGPITTNIQGITGVQQGVLIARINDDIALANFEREVQQMIYDLETLYWQLHLAYRSFAIYSKARDAALDTWRTVDAQILGSTGPGGSTEAELRDIYLNLKNQTAVARDSIYAAEAQLRLMMGLSVNDGRIIRPCEQPMSAEFVPDWSTSLADAFLNRPEIRRQKFSIRSLELQLRAARNLTMPRLDFVSGYQVNAFGDDLFDQGNGTSGGLYPSAYETLADRDQTGWNLGFEFSVPLGRRYAFAQMQSIELKLAKAQKVLGEQEVEISHEIAAAFRDIDRSYVSLENNYNRLQVARDRLSLAKAQYRSDPTQVTLESIVRAHQSLAQAELTFVNNLIEYNTAISNLSYRNGKTLLMNNIRLVEGPWAVDAQRDAQRQFEKRQHAIPTAEFMTSPAPF